MRLTLSSVLAAAFLMLASAPIAGQEYIAPAAAELLRFTRNPFESSGRGPSRLQLARALSQYCVEALNAIPRNTPREDDWVLGEMDTTDLARLTRLDRSLEYSRWLLAKTLNECVVNTSWLAGGASMPATKEARLWARLIMTFNGTEDLRVHATRVGLASASTDAYAIYSLSSVRYALTRAIMGALDEAK